MTYNTIQQMMLSHVKANVLDPKMIHNLAFITSLGLYKSNQITPCISMYLSAFLLTSFL